MLAGTCVVVAACTKKENATDTSRADTTRRDTTAATTPAAPQLTDANIAAILDEANAADSTDGAVASKKGTRADVRQFGQRMMRDHHQLRQQGQDLAKKLNLTPQPPANDTAQTAAKRWNDSLNAMTKGASWDRAYIDHEVARHQSVLQTAQSAQGQAQNQELKDLITKAAPAIQGHLTLAQSIQSKLGNAGATGAKAATKSDSTKGAYKRP
jgi:putative membrane protein